MGLFSFIRELFGRLWAKKAAPLPQEEALPHVEEPSRVAEAPVEVVSHCEIAAVREIKQALRIASEPKPTLPSKRQTQQALIAQLVSCAEAQNRVLTQAQVRSLLAQEVGPADLKPYIDILAELGIQVALKTQPKPASVVDDEPEEEVAPGAEDASGDAVEREQDDGDADDFEWSAEALGELSSLRHILKEEEKKAEDEPSLLQDEEEAEVPPRTDTNEEPLSPLTLEQEQELFRRIEESRREVRELFNCLPVAPRLYANVLDYLDISGETGERFDRVVTDKYADKRDTYVNSMKPEKQVLWAMGDRMAEAYAALAKAEPEAKEAAAQAVKELCSQMLAKYQSLHFKQEMLEKICDYAEVCFYRPCIELSLRQRRLLRLGKSKKREQHLAEVVKLKAAIAGGFTPPEEPAAWTPFEQRFVEQWRPEVFRRFRAIICKGFGMPIQMFVSRFKELRKALAKGFWARVDIVEANLRLVETIVETYRDCGLEFDDLVQEGRVGLMKAIDRFDPQFGTRFSTHASNWIRQSVMRAIGKQSHLIYIPKHWLQLSKQVQCVKENLSEELRREPTVEEIAHALNCSVELVRFVEALPRIQTPSSEVENDDSPSNPVEEAEYTSLKEAMREVLYSLNEREREVLDLRFGLTDGIQHTLEEVGSAKGVTRERIRQIEAKALRKLRHPSRIKKLEGFLSEQS